MILRDYQIAAIAAIDAQHASVRSTLLVMATGTGKTVTFMQMAKERSMMGLRTLVIAHRRELVEQAARCAQDLGLSFEIEMADSKAGTLWRSDVVVASVQTLQQKHRLHAFHPAEFGLVVIDECFPAGTLVGDVEIERVRVGQGVPSWCERSRRLVRGTVRRVFISRPSGLLRVTTTSGRSVVCTPGHPFLTLRGWVPAAVLSCSDMVLCTNVELRDMRWRDEQAERATTRLLHSLQGCAEGGAQEAGRAAMLMVCEPSDRYDEERASIGPARTGLLLGGAQECMGGQVILRADGDHQSQVCVGAHARAQPNATQGRAGEGQPAAPGDGVDAFGARRERAWADGTGAAPGVRAGVGDGDLRSDPPATRIWLPDALQDRRWQPRAEDSDRSGRDQPSGYRQASSGPQERGAPRWTRVVSTEVLQPGRDGTFGGMCPDGLVYNLAVDDTHTYVADGFVVHNCHHAIAQSYRKVVSHFLGAPRCRVVGVTATPDRGDGSAMRAMFESVAYEYGIQQGIADGFLARIIQKRIDVDGLDLSTLKTNAGDFSESELEEVLTQEKHLHSVGEPTVRMAGTRPTIVFCASVAHAHSMAEVINRYAPATEHGQAAVALDGESDPQHRADVLRAFAQRRVQFLVNCALFLEGTDLPLTACVAMARPTKSRALYAQAVGRGTRIAEGKTDLLVLDFVGLSGKHKLISPTDILAGKDDDEEVLTIAKRISHTVPDPEEALAKARTEAADEKKRREVALRVKAKTKIFDTDPFSALGLAVPAAPDNKEEPTVVQLEKLKKYGVPITEGMTRAQCGAIIWEMHRRREAGLCTYKQARFLEKRGVKDAKKLTFDQATAEITRIATQQGWGRAS